jgi:hypothetical protein
VDRLAVLGQLDRLIAEATPGDRPALVVALGARLAQLGAGLVGLAPARGVESKVERGDLASTLEVVRGLEVLVEDARAWLAAGRDEHIAGEANADPDPAGRTCGREEAGRVDPGSPGVGERR